MTVYIRPINKDDTPGFTLDSFWINGSELISWLVEAGMEKATTSNKNKIDTILTVDAPESIEAALIETIDKLTGNNTKSLDYIQQLDDLVFDNNTQLPGNDPSKCHNIPSLVSEIYEDLLGDNASSYFSDKRFQILVLSCVYVCVRAYSECSLRITDTLPESEQKRPVDPVDANETEESIPDDHAKEIIDTAIEKHKKTEVKPEEEDNMKSESKDLPKPSHHKSSGKTKTHKRGKNARK